MSKLFARLISANPLGLSLSHTHTHITENTYSKRCQLQNKSDVCTESLGPRLPRVTVNVIQNVTTQIVRAGQGGRMETEEGESCKCVLGGGGSKERSLML